MQDSKKSEFLSMFKTSLEEGTFIRLVLGKYRGEDELERLMVVPVIIQNNLHLSFRYHYKRSDTTKNLTNPAGMQLLEKLLGADFLSATLFTSQQDMTLQYSRKRVPQLSVSKATFSDSRIHPHNREKKRFVDPHAPWLQLLGISDSHGQIRRAHYDKYRQIDKFVEIVDSLIRDTEISTRKELRVVDYGSGKSYLTFALYDYLTGKRAMKVSVTGVEIRAELVAESNKAAEECGFVGLHFEANNILDYPVGPAEMVVALHACDTATDDAILRALESSAEIIIVAPCCHKYLRPRLTIPDNLHPLMKHGIQRERFATLLTDSLRSLTLEMSGYRTKVFEFISSEHTDKNTMIVAQRQELESSDELRIEGQIRAITRLFGLDDFYLDRILADSSDPGCA